MVFSELIKTQSWPSVEAMLMHYFPKYQSSISGFKRAFLSLQTIEPLADCSTLKLNRIKGNDVKVTCVRKGEENIITATPWAEVLGMTVKKQTLTQFTQPEIAALVLWVITFYGFDEETIKKKSNE